VTGRWKWREPRLKLYQGNSPFLELFCLLLFSKWVALTIKRTVNLPIKGQQIEANRQQASCLVDTNLVSYGCLEGINKILKEGSS
jgi:hypothetical protein